MAVCMLGAAIACFVLGNILEKKEIQAEATKKAKADEQYGSIFKDEVAE